MDNIVLQVSNLTKRFGNRIAVDNISFDIHEGEIFGFLGPNGAGKTTAIRMITGLAKPTYGDATICGKSITKKFEQAIRNVGGIIENPEMYSNLTGMDNLKYFASLYKGITKERIDEVVRLVGMENRINEKVKNYSLGMRQRVGIAQALLHNPKLLILDEPTNGLDPNGVLEMRRFLKNIAHKERIAIMISSHILAEMELMCDTICIINNGKIVNLKTVDQMKRGDKYGQKIAITVNFPNYAGKLIMAKFNPGRIEVMKNTLTVSLGEENIPAIINLLVSNGVDIYSISAVIKSLEQVFLETVNSGLPSTSIQ